ncbi:hypothetical protein ETU08_04860 [Apibacter muscae]|uniref:hypothetical protein n=1 Tax=Apibacter muscae TaxID=2509004 RepID=UPI0011ACD871|nr:hypothetical protein [Apibacter muscae]TWP30429.1 hypothetical protein ETU08_04860 [Apibacter muscae]
MKKYFKAIPISLFTILICYALGYFSIEYIDSYALTIFLFLPSLLGFLPSWIVLKQKNNSINVYRLSIYNLIISLLFLLIFAYEGLICIVMAFPILALLTAIGTYIAKIIYKYKFQNKSIGIVIFFSSVLFLSFDSLNKNVTLIPVSTSVVIQAPIETVWQNVIEFDSIPTPKEFIFKTGIAYPTHANIVGTGENAIRYCNFTTGSFVEPITHWGLLHYYNLVF